MDHGVVPNVAMLIAGGGAVEPLRRPGDVRSIMIANVIVPPDRKRQVDPQKVDQICESIRELGLLQPIGVKYQKSGQPLRLIYGHHRLLAKLQLLEADPTQDTIAAVIFPENMPDWACELAEVAENLCRKELTPKERDAHTTIYAGLLKQHGAVVRNKPGPKVKVDPSHSGHLPSVTGKVAADLGISDDTVRNRVKNAAKLAARNGVTVTKATPEAMSGEQMTAVGNAALKVAEGDRAEATRAGKSARHINPNQPTKATVATVRLDITDPEPFITWCRARIKGRHKPMSIDILKTYAAALAALIAEIESRP